MSQPGRTAAAPDRSVLMAEHADAKARREAAPLGSDAYRLACEDVAAAEIAIALMEEPPPTVTSPAAAEAASRGA
jgi:hypothetical protein